MIPFFNIPPIKIYSLEFHAFGILVALGFYAGTQLALYRAKHLKLRQDVVSNMSLITIIAGIMGAHIFHVVFYEPELLKNPLNLLKFWSGLSSYGGILFSTVAFIFFMRLKKQPVLPYIDLMALAGCLGFTFGRMGCFVAHDHPGGLSNFFAAVQYPAQVINGKVISFAARHDLGLYEAFLWFGIFIFMMIRSQWGKKKPSFWGKDFLTIVTLYAPGRFFLEFFRATDVVNTVQPDARYAGLTPAHYVSLGLFAICISIWTYRATVLKPKI